MNRFSVECSAEDFDFAETVTCGQVFRWDVTSCGVATGVDGDTWFRIWRSDPDRIEVETSHGLAEFQALFRWSETPAAIHSEILRQDPTLEDVCRRMRGVRLMRPSDPVEALFSFLCTSNNHIRRISTMVTVLASCGPLIAAGHHRFPSLERLAELNETWLRSKGFGYRAKTIPQVALALHRLGGVAYLDEIRSASIHECTQELQKLPGVGPKLADCIALYALHRTDAVPVDTHVWQAYVRRYRPEWDGTNLTAKRYVEIGDALRDRFGHRAAWVQHLLFWENLNKSQARRGRTVGTLRPHGVDSCNDLGAGVDGDPRGGSRT